MTNFIKYAFPSPTGRSTLFDDVSKFIEAFHRDGMIVQLPNNTPKHIYLNMSLSKVEHASVIGIDRRQLTSGPCISLVIERKDDAHLYDHNWVLFSQDSNPDGTSKVKKVVIEQRCSTDSANNHFMDFHQESRAPVDMNLRDLMTDILQTLHDHVPEFWRHSFADYAKARYGIEIKTATYEPSDDEDGPARPRQTGPRLDK